MRCFVNHLFYIVVWYQVKPVIDIRNCWKMEGDEVERIPGQPVTRQLYEYDADTIMYDYQGNIYCYCTVTHRHQFMAFKGYEKKRRPLKYLCPVKAWDMTCHFNPSVLIS